MRRGSRSSRERRDERRVDARARHAAGGSSRAARSRPAASAFAIRPSCRGLPGRGARPARRARSRSGSRARRPAGTSPAQAQEPLEDAALDVARTRPATSPSSIPNSKFVSHWIASWSCGIAARIRSSSTRHRRLVRRARRSAWSSSATKALTGASGVGSETWKRQPARDHAVALQPREVRVRGRGRVCVAELARTPSSRPRSVAQSQPRQRAVGAGRRRRDLELRARAEHRVLPDDPVGARACLAVGQAAQAVAECGARCRKTSSGPPSGTLPTRCTPIGRKSVAAITPQPTARAARGRSDRDTPRRRVRRRGRTPVERVRLPGAPSVNEKNLDIDAYGVSK